MKINTTSPSARTLEMTPESGRTWDEGVHWRREVRAEVDTLNRDARSAATVGHLFVLGSPFGHGQRTRYLSLTDDFEHLGAFSRDFHGRHVAPRSGNARLMDVNAVTDKAGARLDQLCVKVGLLKPAQMFRVEATWDCPTRPATHGLAETRWTLMEHEYQAEELARRIELYTGVDCLIDPVDTHIALPKLDHAYTHHDPSPTAFSRWFAWSIAIEASELFDGLWWAEPRWAADRSVPSGELFKTAAKQWFWEDYGYQREGCRPQSHLCSPSKECEGLLPDGPPSWIKKLPAIRSEGLVELDGMARHEAAQELWSRAKHQSATDGRLIPRVGLRVRLEAGTDPSAA